MSVSFDDLLDYEIRFKLKYVFNFALAIFIMFVIWFRIKSTKRVMSGYWVDKDGIAAYIESNRWTNGVKITTHIKKDDNSWECPFYDSGTVGLGGRISIKPNSSGFWNNEGSRKDRKGLWDKKNTIKWDDEKDGSWTQHISI